jgi:hypothetical protein
MSSGIDPDQEEGAVSPEAEDIAATQTSEPDVSEVSSVPENARVESDEAVASDGNTTDVSSDVSSEATAASLTAEADLDVSAPFVPAAATVEFQQMPADEVEERVSLLIEARRQSPEWWSAGRNAFCLCGRQGCYGPAQGSVYSTGCTGSVSGSF